MRSAIIILSLLTRIISSSGQTLNKPYDIHEIDSINYFALKVNVHTPNTKSQKITDFELVKKMLHGRVIWSEEGPKEMEEMVYKIIFDNGKIISYNYPQYGFIAYYPDEDILILEGEHSSSGIFNLSTGEDRNNVGDPEYWHYSPSRRYRLNGYYNGQMNIYFIQEKQREKYETILDLKFIELIGINPEYITDIFWQNDSILNFTVPYYFYPKGKTENSYYQLIL